LEAGVTVGFYSSVNDPSSLLPQVQCGENPYILFSYFTCIAQKTADGILFNVCKYSTTTSKQQTYTRRELERRGKKFTEVGADTHIQRGTTDLTRYVKKEAA
jgi:hypothetical protein